MSGTVRTKTVFHLRSKKGGGPRWATDSGECSVELICFDPQAALSIHGMCGGPMLGLFSLGILFPFVNWKVSLPHPSSHFPTETGPQTFFSLLSVLLGKAICLCQKRMGASFYSRTKQNPSLPISDFSEAVLGAESQESSGHEIPYVMASNLILQGLNCLL